MEVGELKRLLSYSWCRETCSPNAVDNWSVENLSLGQCAVTALIVNDYYGGKIMRCVTTTGSHYYNIVDDEIIDLTADQFLGELPDYSKGEERSRDYLLNNKDTCYRYTLLNIYLQNTIDEEKTVADNRYQMCVKQRKEEMKLRRIKDGNK